METVVFIQSARLNTHYFCSPSLKLGGLLRQVHNQLVVLLLAPGKFFLSESQLVHFRGKRSRVLN
jgi:hypothetical protein